MYALYGSETAPYGVFFVGFDSIGRHVEHRVGGQEVERRRLHTGRCRRKGDNLFQLCAFREGIAPDVAHVAAH